MHDISQTLDGNPRSVLPEFTENSPADSLSRGIGAIVARLWERLTEACNPLGTDPQVWPHTADWAASVVLECAWSLQHARPSVRVTRMTETYWAEVEEQPWSWEPRHTGEAGRILFEEIADALPPGCSSEQTRSALQTANSVVTLRMEATQTRASARFLSDEHAANQDFRRFLARELHDRIGSAVSLANRQLELYELLADQQAHGDAGGRLRALKSALFELNQHLRQLISEQRRSERGGSLHTALQAYVTALDLTLPRVRIEICGEESFAPPHHLDELFIVLRECVRNSVRHARAETVLIAVRFEHGEIRAIASDDGVGFDVGARTAAGPGPSTGLTSLTERVEALGGRVRLLSAPGEGTRTMILIPIATSSNEGESS
ncbi:ATP-binding protein [Nocardiopsis sp. NPDC049922]|uniref:sensor histidine kinase n=1 Tax=Nocardiopsis sp. NPDC049922 TaxID=3155157 RepID=UPI0033E6E381